MRSSIAWLLLADGMAVGLGCHDDDDNDHIHAVVLQSEKVSIFRVLTAIVIVGAVILPLS